ncbi:MAG: TusE/DsrC/DsvC family sulfur relay protein [Wenzhouxiangellaceae bacterium]|nr:TusE/DsrC/DsvC family sulfur relay protein [Wenzhouxiangellaceae bacterium]
MSDPDFVRTDDGGEPPWSERHAWALARADGIELSELHWWMIRFVRRHWLDYGTPPLMRVTVAAMRRETAETDASSRTLYRLFADGPIKTACRYAGVPPPDVCI